MQTSPQIRLRNSMQNTDKDKDMQVTRQAATSWAKQQDMHGDA